MDHRRKQVRLAFSHQRLLSEVVRGRVEIALAEHFPYFSFKHSKS